MVQLNLSGLRFGGVTALQRTDVKVDGKYKWLCVCDCGEKFVTSGPKLKSGEVISCPACSRERVRLGRVTHGMRNSVEYRTWTHIKSRCYNPNVPEYDRYGGRGISVCSRWLESFDNFLSDMGPRPSASHSIDRFPDNDGNYEPGNCRWATNKEQNNNTRANRKIAIEGETKNMSQWADAIGVPREVVFKRLKRGISGADLLAPRFKTGQFVFQGVSASIPEWSRRTGIKRATLYWRINDQKWPLEKALTQGASQ
jgi:hypothetical protein